MIKRKKSKGLYSIDSIYNLFERQIKIEYQNIVRKKTFTYNSDILIKCPSYLKMWKFTEGLSLNLNDWKRIRDDEYWNAKQELKGIELDIYILEKIQEYKTKNNII